MSSDSMLYLSKSKRGYQLAEYQGDSKMYSKYHQDLTEALKEAQKIMREEDIEYGLRLGKL